VDLRDFLEHSPPDSAYARASNPAWPVTLDVQLLREVEHGLRVLAWQRTKDAERGDQAKHYPERIPLTEQERREAAARKGVTEYDAIPIDEMRKRLGWTTDGRRAG
jgi:hypothetical protein